MINLKETTSILASKMETGIILEFNKYCQNFVHIQMEFQTKNVQKLALEALYTRCEKLELDELDTSEIASMYSKYGK